MRKLKNKKDAYLIDNFYDKRLQVNRALAMYVLAFMNTFSILVSKSANLVIF